MRIGFKEKPGFWVGLALGAIHLGLVCLAYFPTRGTTSACTAAGALIPFMYLDAPLSFLTSVPCPWPILYGVLGTAMWFLIPVLLGKSLAALVPGASPVWRVILILGLVPLVLYGFGWLARLNVKTFMFFERPAGLRHAGVQVGGGSLLERVVFEGEPYSWSVQNIQRTAFGRGAEERIAVAFGDGVFYLDREFTVKEKVKFKQNATTVEVVDVEGDGIPEYLTYSILKKVELLAHDGRPLWTFSRELVEGVCPGDMDGDGHLEFAAHFSYREGVCLLDSKGREKWSYPSYALEDAGMADVDGDGKQEAVVVEPVPRGSRIVRLNDDGVVVRASTVPFKIMDFAILNWPDRGGPPRLLFSDEGVVGIVDFSGDQVARFEAPQCPSFGEIAATTVRFEKGKPSYLAVRKSVHPDLSVLFIFDPAGKLVHQKTETVEGVMRPVLLAVPALDGGDSEKLLVGSAREGKGLVSEFSMREGSTR